MKVNRTFAKLSLLPILVFASIQCSKTTSEAGAQERPKIVAVPGAIKPPAPALQGTATGEVQSFKFRQQGLKASVLAHPVPQVSLLFVLGEKQASTVKVELPPEARKFLLDCWKAEIAYYYKRAFESSPLEKRINEKYALGRVNQSVLSNLETVTIDTPTGKRRISWDEAGDLVRFMAEAAQQVVEQAKEYKRPKSIA